MRAVGRALVRAMPLLVDRRVQVLFFVPLLAAVVLWLVAAYVFWAPLSATFSAAIAGWISTSGMMTDGGWVARAGGGIATFALLTLAVGVLALAAIAVLAGPVFVRVVEAHHFPALERKHGGTWAGGAANALVAILLWLPLWLIALPFLLVPVIGVPLSLLVNAWLNQRLFRYDALAEHASADERVALFRVARGRLMGLGLAVAPLSFVPVVNLISPVYAGLAFTCLCLDELSALRARAAAQR